MKSRAAILHDVGGPWSVEDFELDPPKAGEVLVEMAAAGLCHSDEHILNGDMGGFNVSSQHCVVNLSVVGRQALPSVSSSRVSSGAGC